MDDSINGVIFTKAQQAKNFVGVYTAVFERLPEVENEEDMVWVLGEVGG